MLYCRVESNTIKGLTSVALQALGYDGIKARRIALFVAGWRPLIGWICGASLAWQFVVMPMGLWSAAVFGVHLPTPPSLDGMLWELMFAMLGMGGLRTFEKIRGVAAK